MPANSIAGAKYTLEHFRTKIGRLFTALGTYETYEIYETQSQGGLKAKLMIWARSHK